MEMAHLFAFYEYRPPHDSIMLMMFRRKLQLLLMVWNCQFEHKLIALNLLSLFAFTKV